MNSAVIILYGDTQCEIDESPTVLTAQHKRKIFTTEVFVGVFFPHISERTEQQV